MHRFVEQQTHNNDRQGEILLQGLANLTNVANEMRTYTTRLDSSLLSIQETLGNISDTLARSASSPNSDNSNNLGISQPVAIPQIILKQPENPPSFRDNVTNPIRFIQDIEKYFKKSNIQGAQQLEAALECLEGPARNWSTIYKPSWKTYEDFRKDFLNNYWSDLEQGKIRHMILTGTWKNRHTMGDHFAYYVNLAQQLTNPFQETELVSLLLRHFPIHVQSLWSLKPNKTLAEAASFLKQQEDIVHYRNDPSRPATTVDRRAHTNQPRAQPYPTGRNCPPREPRRVNAMSFVPATENSNNASGNGAQSNQ